MLMSDLVRASRWLYKVREWCARYLPAEVTGTVVAVVGAVVVSANTDDRLVAAIVGTFGEGVGFYGVIVVGELRRRSTGGRSVTIRMVLLVVGATAAEFGGAELLDSLLVRPLAMYVGPLLIGNVAGGVVIGKLLADLVFYGCVISSYELIRRHARSWHAF
jgi:hypothetical protein